METGHSGMSSQAFPTHTGTARHTAELLLALPQVFRAPLMTCPLLHTSTMRTQTVVTAGLFYDATGGVSRAEPPFCEQVAALGMSKDWQETPVNA